MKVATMFNAGDEEALKALAAFAADPANRYKPGTGVTPPGDDPRYVRLFSYTVVNSNVGVLTGILRVVFSYTEAKGQTLRHASFSVASGGGRPGIHVSRADDLEAAMKSPDRNDLPPPSAVQAACFALGFKRRLEQAICGQDPKDPSIIIVAEPIE